MATERAPARKPFAARLEAARRMAGCETAKAGAERLGIRYGTYSRWERGEVEPNIAQLALICERFGVSADLLVSGRERTPRPVIGPVVVNPRIRAGD